MTTLEVLRATRRRLADPANWCKLPGATADGTCIAVALTRSSGVAWGEPHQIVTRVVCGEPNAAPHLHRWNDDPRTTHADVLAVLDRAIEVVRGPNAEPAGASAESHPRVKARRSIQTGSDGWSAAPTLEDFLLLADALAAPSIRED